MEKPSPPAPHPSAPALPRPEGPRETPTHPHPQSLRASERLWPSVPTPGSSSLLASGWGGLSAPPAGSGVFWDGRTKPVTFFLSRLLP